MRCDPLRQTNISEPLLREIATSLGAKRCSVAYLEALRIILGNMAHADRLGVRLRLPLDVPFASERTMRTIITQMETAGMLRRDAWTDSLGRAHLSSVYWGRMEGRGERLDVYSRIQREQEEADFRRSMTALGIEAADCH